MTLSTTDTMLVITSVAGLALTAVLYVIAEATRS